MDLFDKLTWAEILEKTTFLDTPILTVLIIVLVDGAKFMDFLELQ
jgi:hypothetical protein